MKWAPVGFLVAALLCGCGNLVESKHPISDASDSVVDAALIGWWEVLPDKPKEGQDLPRLAVGRRKGQERTLEIAFMEIDKSGEIEVQRAPVFAYVHENVRYLSLRDESADQKEFVLLRYAIDAKGILTVRWLDVDKVVKAIDAETVAGEVKKNEKYDPLDFSQNEYDKVHLTATKVQLRAWLAKAGDGPWHETTVRLRKLKLGKRSGK